MEPVPAREPEKTDGDTQTRPKRRTPRASQRTPEAGRSREKPQNPEDATGEGENEENPPSTRRQERPRQRRRQGRENREARGGGADTGGEAKVVPEGGETPSKRRHGPRGENGNRSDSPNRGRRATGTRVTPTDVRTGEKKQNVRHTGWSQHNPHARVRVEVSSKITR